MQKLPGQLLYIIGAMSLLACNHKVSRQADAVKKSPAIVVKDTSKVTRQKEIAQPEQHATMTFVAYNDDGDYYQLIAEKGDATHYFINADDKDRSLNRGDLIKIAWKKGIITQAGDNDAPEAAELLISVGKVADGPVSKLRKQYGRQLKYTWAPAENYSADYLDKIYRLVEYYLSGTENTLLRDAITRKEEINYSIESREHNGRQYTVTGIGLLGANGTNIVQWLYIDQESEKLYVYDLADDKLIPHH